MFGAGCVLCLVLSVVPFVVCCLMWACWCLFCLFGDRCGVVLCVVFVFVIWCVVLFACCWCVFFGVARAFGV